MKDVELAEFKSKCSALLKQVKTTREPMRVTYLGQPLAEIIPVVAPKIQNRSSWIGSLRDSMEIIGDIVSPPVRKGPRKTLNK